MYDGTCGCKGIVGGSSALPSRFLTKFDDVIGNLGGHAVVNVAPDGSDRERELTGSPAFLIRTCGCVGTSKNPV